MKILIVYASAGAGHFKAAEALYKYLKKQSGDEVLFLDVLQKSSYLFHLSYTRGYTFLINHLVFLWRLAFWITYTPGLRRISRCIASFLNSINTGGFAKFLEQESPDYIISTHFLPSEIAANLKRAGKIKSKLITIITDFGAHPFWISAGTDLYVVASSLTKKQLVEEGVSENIIKDSGIPIDEKFLKSCDKKELCVKIGIRPDKFTVLIVTGSFGLGPIEEVTDELHNDMQLLVVCANNKGLYQRLKKKGYHNTIVSGFVDNLDELMSVSDIIITKPGGLTISEVLVKRIVPVFISPIPGQETENIRVLDEYGVGISVKNTEDIKGVLMDYKEHPGKLELIKSNAGKISKPEALKEIFSVIR